MASENFNKNTTKVNRDAHNNSARKYATENRKFEQEKNRTERIRQDYYKTPIGKMAKAADAGKRIFEDLLEREDYNEAKRRHKYEQDEAAVKERSEKLIKSDAEQKIRYKERQHEKERIYNTDIQRELRKKRLTRGR